MQLVRLLPGAHRHSARRAVGLAGAMDTSVDCAHGLGPMVHHGPAAVTAVARHGSGLGLIGEQPVWHSQHWLMKGKAPKERGHDGELNQILSNGGEAHCDQGDGSGDLQRSIKSSNEPLLAQNKREGLEVALDGHGFAFRRSSMQR